jgi:hypothetical protein
VTDPWERPSDELFASSRKQLSYRAQVRCPGTCGRLVAAVVDHGFDEWLWTVGGARTTSRSLAIERTRRAIGRIPEDRARFEAEDAYVDEDVWAEEEELYREALADLQDGTEPLKQRGHVMRVDDMEQGFPAWCPGCGTEYALTWDGRTLSLTARGVPE